MDVSGIIIGLLIAAVFMIIAAMRKGSNAVSTKPSRILNFTIKSDLKEVRKLTLEFSQNGKYELDQYDEDSNRFILSDKATATSWGFFYPIYLESRDDSTFIEIGIKSKAVQVGPVVSRSHERFFNAYKAFLLINKSN